MLWDWEEWQRRQMAGQGQGLGATSQALQDQARAGYAEEEFMPPSQAQDPEAAATAAIQNMLAEGPSAYPQEPNNLSSILAEQELGMAKKQALMDRIAGAASTADVGLQRIGQAFDDREGPPTAFGSPWGGQIQQGFNPGLTALLRLLASSNASGWGR